MKPEKPMDMDVEYKIEVRQQRIASLKFRITLFVLFFFVAIFGVFIITSVMQISTVTRFVCARIGLPVVDQVSSLIDGDAFEALSLSLDPQDPYNEETRLKMLAIKQTINCRYLYTMAPVSTSVYRYIIDGSTTPDDEEDFSPLGAEEDVSAYDDAFFVTVRTKESQLGTIDLNETWGNLISTYAPILNSRGDLVGIIGCDLEADTIIAWIKTQIIWQVGVVLAFTILAIAVYLALITRVNRLLT
jgi:methyl-accepting chemotaxis protein